MLTRRTALLSFLAAPLAKLIPKSAVQRFSERNLGELRAIDDRVFLRAGDVISFTYNGGPVQSAVIRVSFRPEHRWPTPEQIAANRARYFHA